MYLHEASTCGARCSSVLWCVGTAEWGGVTILEREHRSLGERLSTFLDDNTLQGYLINFGALEAVAVHVWWHCLAGRCMGRRLHQEGVDSSILGLDRQYYSDLDQDRRLNNRIRRRREAGCRSDRRVLKSRRRVQDFRSGIGFIRGPAAQLPSCPTPDVRCQMPDARFLHQRPRHLQCSKVDTEDWREIWKLGASGDCTCEEEGAFENERLERDG